jgi:20S proteasome alpha/beta subunit
MLSAVNDVVAARDNATMKNLRLTKKWGIMFSANSELLYPFAQLATLRLANLENESDYTRLVDVDNSLHEAESACVSAYKTLINRRTVQEYLSRIGFSSIEDFKVDGLSTFGQEIFFNYFNKIETFDLGIEFIVYGFDKKGSPHIITIENPGVVRNIKRYVSE